MSKKTYTLETDTTQDLIDYVDTKLPRGTNLANYLYSNVIKTDNPDLELVKFLFTYRDKFRKETGRNYPDLFGDFMCHNKSKLVTSQLGQFLTPYSVCDLMAGIALANMNKVGTIKLDEPTCGTGRNVLAVYEWFSKNPSEVTEILYYCTDLDFEAYIYMLMNAFLHQIPHILVMQGNTLIAKQESLERAVRTVLDVTGNVYWRECRDLARKLPCWNA